MRTLIASGLGAAAALALTGCPEIPSTTFEVTVDNNSIDGTLDTDRMNGSVPLSPGIFVVHEGENPVFEPGETASPGLERLAEDGLPGGDLGGMLLDEIEDLDQVEQAGTFQGAGQDGLPYLAAGERATFTIQASPGDRLTLLTGFMQSNDWFYALESIDLFEGGAPISGDYTPELQLYDAGTEEDTAPGTGDSQAIAQQEDETDVGPSESETIQRAVERHPDFAIPETGQVIQVRITTGDSFP